MRFSVNQILGDIHKKQILMVRVRFRLICRHLLEMNNRQIPKTNQTQ